MPRLCPHCRKLGISMWKTLWATPNTPIECSNCHQLVRLKPDWRRRAALLAPAVGVTLCLYFRVPEAGTIGTVVALMVLATDIFYHRAVFVPYEANASPPEERTS